MAGRAAVWDDQAGAPVAAVGDHSGAAVGGLRAGQLLRCAVVAVAGQRPADGDDEPSDGVYDGLVVGGVPGVFGLLGDAVVAGGDQGAVHGQASVRAEPLTRLQGECGSKMVDDAVGRGLGHPNSGAS